MVQLIGSEKQTIVYSMIRNTHLWENLYKGSMQLPEVLAHAHFQPFISGDLYSHVALLCGLTAASVRLRGLTFNPELFEIYLRKQALLQFAGGIRGDIEPCFYNTSQL